jgi:uncharacterized protein YjiS (DUF1127 family)
MADIDWGRLIIRQEPSGLQLLGQTLSLWLRRLRDRDQLAHIDERGLRDIGLTRADAEVEIAKPFWRS